MKEMTALEVRETQLNVLSHVDEFCRKNKIEYSLGGGSLLGAIRHKGFIPWDDDIDIMLERSHYDNLIKIWPNISPHKLWSYRTTTTYQHFSKIYDGRTIVKSTFDHMYKGIGVYIDVFPIDSLPAIAKQRVQFIKDITKKSEDLASSNFPAFVSGSKWYYLLARLFIRFPRFLKYHGKSQILAQSLDQEMQTYNKQNVPEKGFVASRYSQKEHFPREVFDSYEDVKFEGLTVKKIKDHDVYLKQLYGNYMQLPPENKRISHSYYHWYWKKEK